MPDPSDARLVLTPTQQSLYEAVADRRNDVAVCYHAAVVILDDDVMPDRLALAAHALRELMEKLPGDEMAVDMGADLNTKVNALRPPWEGAVAEEEQRGGEQWGNGIGAALRTFLGAVGEFFRGRNEIVAGRREQAVQFLNRLDVAAVPLPTDVQRQNAQEWMRLRGYFNDVSHHRFVPEEQAFQLRVMQLEGFLSARLIRRPTDDFAAIDALLKEDEPNAQA
jgi:hypothetical protein